VFEFLSLLGTGETVSSATVTVTVWSGVDANPSALKSGAASCSGTRVTQTFTGGLEGVIYLITVLGTTSTSQVVSLQSLLALVKNPA
jgi:hypothetical protein